MLWIVEEQFLFQNQFWADYLQMLIPNYMTRQIIFINIIHHIKVIMNTLKVQVNQDNMHCRML